MGELTSYLKKKFPKANAERILGAESEYDYKRKVKKLYNLLVFCDLLQIMSSLMIIDYLQLIIFSFIFFFRMEPSSITRVALVPCPWLYLMEFL